MVKRKFNRDEKLEKMNLGSLDNGNNFKVYLKHPDNIYISE